MPADQLHVDHGRVAAVCDRLERTPHQDAVGADHQKHFAQTSDPFDWLVIEPGSVAKPGCLGARTEPLRAPAQNYRARRAGSANE